MIGHVVFGIVCRTVCLRVGIDTEDGEVAGLARPHPVVGLTAKLTHRLGNGEDQTHVAEVLIGGGIILVALVERVDVDMQRGVDLLDGVGHGIGQRVDD